MSTLLITCDDARCQGVGWFEQPDKAAHATIGLPILSAKCCRRVKLSCIWTHTHVFTRARMHSAGQAQTQKTPSVTAGCKRVPRSHGKALQGEVVRKPQSVAWIVEVYSSVDQASHTGYTMSYSDGPNARPQQTTKTVNTLSLSVTGNQQYHTTQTLRFYHLHFQAMSQVLIYSAETLKIRPRCGVTSVQPPRYSTSNFSLI